MICMQKSSIKVVLKIKLFNMSKNNLQNFHFLKTKMQAYDLKKKIRHQTVLKFTQENDHI